METLAEKVKQNVEPIREYMVYFCLYKLSLDFPKGGEERLRRVKEIREKHLEELFSKLVKENLVYVTLKSVDETIRQYIKEERYEDIPLAKEIYNYLQNQASRITPDFIVKN